MYALKPQINRVSGESTNELHNCIRYGQITYNVRVSIESPKSMDVFNVDFIQKISGTFF